MIYFDHNASSTLRPEVLDALLSVMAQLTGNPSSVHWAGRLARQHLDEARRLVAGLMNVHESRVVFTSNGTEANNLALFGMAANKEFQGSIITSAVEHPSLLRACDQLVQRGMTLHLLPVDHQGRVDPNELITLLHHVNPVLVSVMAANNETGVLQPVDILSNICQQAGIPFHVDATQWVGKIPLDLDDLHADLVTISAHKFGGPKGTAALIVPSDLLLGQQLVGGGQERGRRAGTENLPGIVGFGVAASLVKTAMTMESHTLCELRDHLENRLQAKIPEAVIFGADAKRLPNTTLIGIPGVDGEMLVMMLDLAGFAVSSGSACSSGKTTPSHVLQAMGVLPALSQSAVRITLGWDSTAEAVDLFINAFCRSVDRLLS